jgi:hypothetical protein
MSLAPPADPLLESVPSRVSALRFAPALYAATLFVSALLLFAIQPMFTKIVLPRLGGAPGVWSVAMVFFQTALLLGYAYAHLISRMLTIQAAALVHLGLLAVAATTLPIGIAQGFGPAPASGIEPWLFALFGTSIGLPFLALAASAPLLQNWFAATGHPHAGNPYVLYAASNLGSFAALIAYPFVVEPLLTLRAQTIAWSLCYAALTLLIAGTAMVVARADRRPAAASASSTAAPTTIDRVTWTALAAVPAGLVVAVTAVITTDVAAAPFLWVLPLALYLLTFVAIFRDKPWIAHDKVLFLVPFGAILMIATGVGLARSYWLTTLLFHLLGFTVLALACHGELYRRRPAPARLTEFYLWTSFGGVLGGAFAGLVAPNAFSGIVEYPILILAALLALPGVFAGGARGFMRQAGPILVVVAAAAAIVWSDMPSKATLPLYIGLTLLAGLMLLQRRNPARFFALAALAFAIVALEPGLTRVQQVRNFFGVHRVYENLEGTHRLLLHGTTLHGAERVRKADGTLVQGRPEPLTYYHADGPIAEAIRTARAAHGGFARVAAVGLGTGTLACYRQDGESWTFFEIDPHVVRMARDPALFRYMTMCSPDTPVVLGDARLTLAASPERYDLIVLDAFSSDAIPVHLLTREALAGYLSRLTPRGVIVFHVSNRHMALQRPLAAVSAAEGLIVYARKDYAPVDLEVEFRTQAEVMVFARDVSHLGDLPTRPGWKRIDADPRVSAWTDDYANVLGAIIDRNRRR